MGVLYAQEHTSCFNHVTGDKARIVIAGIDDAGRQVTETFTVTLFFVHAGAVKYSIGGAPYAYMPDGEFTVIPGGRTLDFFAVPGTRLIVIKPEDCVKFGNQPLSGRPGILSHKQTDTCSGYYHAPVREPVKQLLDTLVEMTRQGMHCRFYHELKINELFILLGKYYSPRELSLIFSPCTTPDDGFCGQVYRYYRGYETVRELARAMNYSLKGFERKFKNVFGEPPSRWMKQKKMMRLHSELTYTDKNIKLLADEYGFAGPSQLSEFCRRYFHATPGMLRSNSKKSVFDPKSKKRV